MKAPEPLLVMLGKELVDLRQARGWTSQEAVKQLHAKQGVTLTADSLYNYERARRPIPADRLIHLCALYEVPVSVLWAAASRRAEMVEDRCPMCRRPT